MLRLDQPQALPAIGGFTLAHVEIHLQGANPILRASFVHVDANGAVLPIPPMQFAATGAHLDALVHADGSADSLRTRVYKAFAATLAAKTTIVADAAAPAAAQAQAHGAGNAPA